MMIRQQTTDRQLEECKAENRAVRAMVDELRQQVLALQQQSIQRHHPSAEMDQEYSPVTTFGRAVYLTGVVATTRGHDIELQTCEALTSLKQILHKAGTDIRHVLRVTVYISDIRFADRMYSAWGKFFDVHQVDRGNRPTRITHVACLKCPEIHVEMHAEAVLPAPSVSREVVGLLPGPAGATPA